MRLALAVATLFGARFVVAALYYPRKDADLAWQYWLGERIATLHALPTHLGSETFTANGAPWIPQEWLFSLVVYATLQSHWFTALGVVVALAAAATIVLVGWRAQRRGASQLAIFAITLLVGFAMLQSFGVRAQIFAWPLLALVLLALDTESIVAYAAIALTAVWANLHASALLAPVIAALWTLGAACDDRAWSARVRRGAAVTFGCALATCATPLGWQMPRYAVALAHSPIRQSISEWQPANLHDLAFTLGVMPLLLLVLAGVALRIRPSLRDLLPAGAIIVMALEAVRHLPLAAIVLAPLAAQVLSRSLPDRLRIATLLQERGGAVLIALGTAVGSLAVAGRVDRIDDIVAPSLPQRAVVAAAHLPGTRNLYCEDFAWCSLALGHTNLRTFLDGRCDPFPREVWQAYLAIEQTDRGWRAAFARYAIDTVLAARKRPLARALLGDPHWRVAWSDRRYVLLARK